MQSMSTATFLFLLAIPLAISAICAFVAIRSLRQRAALQAARRIYPSQAEPGYMVIEGTASGQVPVTATLTGKPVVWFSARVDKWQKSGSDSSADWHNIRSEESESPFAIEWESASIMVDPVGADVTPKDFSEWKGATETPANREPEKMLPGQGKRSGPYVEVSGGPNSKFRYTENRIYPGDPLFVLGEIADEDGRLVVGKPASGAPFVISTTEPGAHAGKLRTGATTALVIGGLFDLVVLWMLWARFL